MTEKSLITGGFGFIGSHLAEALAAKGDSVVALDNLHRHRQDGVPLLEKHARIECIEGDVLDPRSLEMAFAGVGTVYHLAAIAGVSNYYKTPGKTLKTNILGTVNVLETAAKAGVKQLVYLSTSEIFGHDAGWVDERAPKALGGVEDARWVYSTSKLAGEQFVKRYGEELGLGTVILRPFNIYGPRQAGAGAIYHFCAAACEGKPLKVFGDGSAIRSWCYVEDFVAATVLAGSMGDAIGEDFNIGNPRATETTLGLAKQVQRLVPGTEIVHEPADFVEIRLRIPSIDKARRILGFEPKIDFPEGIERTLAWYRSQKTPAMA